MPDWNLGGGEGRGRGEVLMHCPAKTRLKHCACLHQCSGRGLFVGLVQSVVGVVIEMVQSSVIAKDDVQLVRNVG